MFRTWLNEHSLTAIDFNTPLFPPAADRGFWGDKGDESYIRAAESYLGYDIPPIRATQYRELKVTGSRVAQEQPHFARRLALSNLILGELCEYQGRFLPDITDLLFAICEESFWGLSAHLKHISPDIILPPADCDSIDLFAAETGALVSNACHLFKEELEAYCPGIIERCEHELERRIKTPYLAQIDEFWMGYFNKVNNWNPWILSNILNVFLFHETNPFRRQTAIKKMLYEINNIYNAYPADGGCDEGADYWMVSGASIFDFCEELYRASNGVVDFFNDEKLHRIGQFEYRAYIGNGYFVNFADAVAHTSHNCGSIFYLFGKRIGDPILSAMAAECTVGLKKNPLEQRSTKLRREIFDLIYQKEINELAPPVLPQSTLLPDLQTAYLRSGDWYLAAKGGHNKENHNHNDVGNFIAYYQNEPILCDPGIGTYTKFTFGSERYNIPGTQSLYHNLPLINGCQQPFGQDFKAESFGLEEHTVTVSFAGAYPDEAGLEKLERAVTVGKEGVDLTDRFTFKAAGNTVAEHFMTPLSVRIEGDTAILGERFALTVPGAALTTDLMDFEGDPKYIRAWNCAYLTRIRFTLKDAETITMKLRKI